MMRAIRVAIVGLVLVLSASLAHAGTVKTQGQLNTELGTSCAGQGKAAACIGPAQMSDLVATAVPGVAASLTAVGSTQGTCAALTSQINDFTTVPVGTGACLPTAVAGQQDTVCNDGANALLIYPASGASIGSNGTNSPVDDSSGQCLTFLAIGPVSWRLIGGNPGSILAAGFYVSPSGSDSNPGTLAAPFQTLGQCQTAMQSGYKLCYLRAGTYPLASGGLILTSADNGETFQYYPPDGVNSPILTTAAVAAAPAIGISCVGCSLIGLTINVNGSLDTGCVTITGSCIPIELNGATGLQFVSNVVNGENAPSPYYLIDVAGAMSNALIAGNTIENWGEAAGGDAIHINGALTNSVIKTNTFQCIAQYGITSAASGSNGNLLYGNNFVGGGHVGGAPPGCGSVVGGGGGADWAPGNSQGNLFVNNTASGNIGYSAVLNSPSGINYIDSSNLSAGDNPVITVDGSPSAGTVVRLNTLTSPASVGINLGTEHDACAETSSAGVLVAHNTITSSFEPLWLTALVNSTIFDNTTNIGTQTTGGGSSHWPAGLSFSSKAFNEGCGSPVYSTGNTIEDNSFTSANGNGGFAATSAEYGVYIDSGGGGNTGNTISHNILYPFGSPGTLAYQPNGVSNTAADNQTSAITSVATAPPIANAGAAQIAAGGQTITLNGSATANFPGGGAAGITYAWTCTVNCTGLTITSPTAATTTVTGLPSKATLNGAAEVIVFQLVATNSHGSTTDRVPVGLDPTL